MSRIGNKPIEIPKDVKVEIRDNSVFVEGPKGKLSQAFSSRITIDVKEDQVKVARKLDTKADRSLHGLYRALVANMVLGVTKGYTKELEIIGVGFKAVVQGKNLNLQLGFSHPVVKLIPEGLTVETPKATQIVIKGIDKEKIGRFSTEIRAVYPPEPYKGKGVRFVGEYVKKKVGKAQVAGGK